jgi:hypothetical protein
VFAGLCAIIALSFAVTYRRRRLGMFIIIVSAFLALPYAFLVSGLAPRFFFPSLVLLGLAGGIAVVDAVAQLRVGVSKWAIAITMLLGVVVIAVPANLDSLKWNEANQLASRSISRVLSETAAPHLSEHCTIVTHLSYPMFEFYSGCSIVRFTPWDGSADASYVAISSTVDRITDKNSDFVVVETIIVDGKEWYILALSET